MKKVQYEEKKPLLSICIPTYNRSKYLKESIESIITQKEFLDGTVEIVISDNASTDDTEQIVAEYAEKYYNIYYSKNEVNVIDKNYPIVLSKAHGTLRRLCNDTLIFYPDALSNICDVIKENQTYRPFIFWSNGSSKRKENIQKTDFKDFVHNISYWMTSIACFSIWDDECENIETDFEGCDLRLWQVRKSLLIAKEKNNVIIANENLTNTQIVKNKDISYGLYNIFYKNYFTLLDPYFKNGSLDLKEKDYLEKDLLFNFFADWVAKWELQADNLKYSTTENLKSAVWNQYKNKPYWFTFITKYYLKILKLKFKKKLKKIVDKK